MKATNKPEVMAVSTPVESWFSTNLKAARLARRLKLAGLADLLGMTAKSISRIEKNEHHYSVALAGALANCLGYELADMIQKPAKFKEMLPK